VEWRPAQIRFNSLSDSFLFDLSSSSTTIIIILRTERCSSVRLTPALLADSFIYDCRTARYAFGPKRKAKSENEKDDDYPISRSDKRIRHSDVVIVAAAVAGAMRIELRMKKKKMMVMMQQVRAGAARGTRGRPCQITRSQSLLIWRAGA